MGLLRNKIKITSIRVIITSLLFCSLPALLLLSEILFLGGEWRLDSSWSLLYGSPLLYGGLYFPPSLLIIVPIIFFPYALIGILITTIFRQISTRAYAIVLSLLFLISFTSMVVLPTFLRLREYSIKNFTKFSIEDCKQLPDSQQDICTNKVVWRLIGNYDTSLNQQICDSVPDRYDSGKIDEQAQFECWRSLAKINSKSKNEDVSFCNKTPDNGTRNYCIIIFAYTRKDKTLCNLIQNPGSYAETQETCAQNITPPTP